MNVQWDLAVPPGAFLMMRFRIIHSFIYWIFNKMAWGNVWKAYFSLKCKVFLFVKRLWNNVCPHFVGQCRGLWLKKINYTVYPFWLYFLCLILKFWSREFLIHCAGLLKNCMLIPFWELQNFQDASFSPGTLCRRVLWLASAIQKFGPFWDPSARRSYYI